MSCPNSHRLSSLIPFFAFVSSVLIQESACQVGAAVPLASPCPSFPVNTDLETASVVCINHHAAVLPYPFHRTLATSFPSISQDSFRLTSVPSDASFAEYVPNATFLVFTPDESVARAILGAAPSYEFVLESRNDSIHEAPVYVPAPVDSIIFSLPHQGIYEQQIINLTDPAAPTIANFTTAPPVYAVNGGKWWNGSIYWAVEGGLPFPNPNPAYTPTPPANGTSADATVYQTPGIYRLDPTTGEVVTLLNNYFGTPFNSPNDLWIEKSSGDVFFTDGWYGYGINVSAESFPALAPATYRFRPSTGNVGIVENTIDQPNGIAFSPDGTTAYISDSGVTDFAHPPANGVLPKYTYNRLLGKAVYAFDVVAGGTQARGGSSYLVNKRPIYLPEEYVVDGLHVSQEGYLVGAVGNGVEVLSPFGELLVRITVPNITVNNIQFAGPERSDLWIFGEGGIARVTWNLTGMAEE